MAGGASGGEHDAAQRCCAEVVGLHDFFERWMSAADEDGDPVSLERLDAVLAEDFEIVSPSGRVADRSAVRARIESARGTRGSDMRIAIRNCHARTLAPGIHLVRYEEWQREGDEQTGRLSSAVLRDREDAPLGLEWLSVHETWLPDAPPGKRSRGPRVEET